MAHTDPLSPWTYLGRRSRQVAPTAMVISLVTVLLIVVITPTNTFHETLQANLRGLEAFTVVAPAARPEFDGEMAALLDGNRFMERRVEVKAQWVRYPVMIGEGSCPLILAEPGEVRALLERIGLRLVAGRYPSGRNAAVLLHEDVARARGLRVGDRMGTLVDPDDNIPGEYRVVGLLRGPTRIAAGTSGSGLLARLFEARMPEFSLVYPKPGMKARSDAYLHAARVDGGAAFQVIDVGYARARSERALRNLPLLIDLVATASGIIVAMVSMLLSMIAFRSRLPEFAVLLAIGQRRGRLLRMLVLELAALAGLAWLAGAGLGLAGITAYDALALRPRGILIRAFDPRVVAATAAVPVLVVLVGAIALWASLRRMDPVAVVQRRVA